MVGFAFALGGVFLGKVWGLWHFDPDNSSWGWGLVVDYLCTMVTSSCTCRFVDTCTDEVTVVFWLLLVLIVLAHTLTSCLSRVYCIVTRLPLR